MVVAPGYLVDKNVLLRTSKLNDPLYGLVKAAIGELNRQGAALYFSLQNIAEFWSVCTRPRDRNGYGLTIAATAEFVEQLERTMTLLPDNEEVYSIWRRLVVDNNVRGVQVHDARLAAIMQAYGVNRILTLNQSDFARYPHVLPVHPDQVQPAPR